VDSAQFRLDHILETDKAIFKKDGINSTIAEKEQLFP
jgi:hypothetical protein